MGRYYGGDIEGKFAFGSQSSCAADRFGVAGCEPGHLDYYYDESNLPDLESELKEIENSFQEYKIPLLAYYELFGPTDNVKITFEDYIKEGGFKAMNENKQSEFNDYRIGRKILDCIKEHGTCSFQAEL